MIDSGTMLSAVVSPERTQHVGGRSRSCMAATWAARRRIGVVGERVRGAAVVAGGVADGEVAARLAQELEVELDLRQQAARRTALAGVRGEQVVERRGAVSARTRRRCSASRGRTSARRRSAATSGSRARRVLAERGGIAAEPCPRRGRAPATRPRADRQRGEGEAVHAALPPSRRRATSGGCACGGRNAKTSARNSAFCSGGT